MNMNTFSFLLSLILLPLVLTTTDKLDEKFPQAVTKYGQVRGTVMKSRSNRNFFAFRGIPYAKPPEGELRFRAPTPPDKWVGIYNATQDANVCIQQNYLFSQAPAVEGSEDCLYLNVYTPKLICNKPSRKKLPVMVFIHYGAFFAGSSRSDVLGPQYFMDKDVVLVTFNYRLGVLGFLSTNDDAAPGNWAFKDQVAALKWVQENIVNFGGDNKRVTLFGQSAGAGSTHHHILSPLSKGLFHAAITQSGSALSLWAKPQTVLSEVIARTQATFVGCKNDTDTFTLVDCLRKVPASNLISSADFFRFMRSEPLTVFTPALEKKTLANPEPFITEDPLEVIAKGNFHNIPWIIGVTSDEGILRAAPFVRQTDLLQTINQGFDKLLPNMLSLSLSVPESSVNETWKAVRNFYFPDHQINISNPHSIQGLINVYSDRAFIYPGYQSALFHSWKGHHPIWFYVFDYRGQLTYGELFAATNNTVDFKWGVSHCDDLLYLFPSPKLLPELPHSDLRMSKVMIEFFTNFATFREPIPRNSIKQKTGWDHMPLLQGRPDVGNNDLHYLRISGPYAEASDRIKFEMSQGPYPDRIFFWEKLPLHENIKGIH